MAGGVRVEGGGMRDQREWMIWVVGRMRMYKGVFTSMRFSNPTYLFKVRVQILGGILFFWISLHINQSRHRNLNLSGETTRERRKAICSFAGVDEIKLCRLRIIITC